MPSLYYQPCLRRSKLNLECHQGRMVLLIWLLTGTGAATVTVRPPFQQEETLAFRTLQTLRTHEGKGNIIDKLCHPEREPVTPVQLIIEVKSIDAGLNVAEKNYIEVCYQTS